MVPLDTHTHTHDPVRFVRRLRHSLRHFLGLGAISLIPLSLSLSRFRSVSVFFFLSVSPHVFVFVVVVVVSLCLPLILGCFPHETGEQGGAGRSWVEVEADADADTHTHTHTHTHTRAHTHKQTNIINAKRYGTKSAALATRHEDEKITRSALLAKKNRPRTCVVCV